jgi:hypothetical protein
VLSDLNNVQDAGDYPFRDGTISVTFAEVAIWKKNPGAQFRLMRKHPIQSAFKYVLGRQIEENLAADDAEFIYESSNGDSGSLDRAACIAVLHADPRRCVAIEAALLPGCAVVHWRVAAAVR